MRQIFKNLVFLVLPITSFCSERDSIRSDKFQLGISYAPEIGCQTLKSTTDYTWLKEIQDQMDTPKFGFSTGIHFGCKLLPKLTLEIQALYADKGYQTKERIIETDISSDPLARVPYKSSSLYSYHYLDIPVKLNYYLTNKKIRLYITAGLSASVFIDQQTTTIIKYKDGSNNKFKSNSGNSAEPVNFSALAGFGLNYNLSDHNVFKLEPVFNYAITPLMNAQIKNYLYTAGIRVGIAHTF